VVKDHTKVSVLLRNCDAEATETEGVEAAWVVQGLCSTEHNDLSLLISKPHTCLITPLIKDAEGESQVSEVVGKVEGVFDH
jgi:hypothetical protein